MKLLLKPILFALVFVTFGCDSTSESSQTEEPLDYQAEVALHRSEKNAMFKGDEDSPLSNLDKEYFNGLKYFPINEKYKVNATLSRITTPRTISTSTSTGEDRVYNKYAWLKFTLNEKSHEMLVLQLPEDEADGYFFLPFTDETSAEETYGGGRYLDIEIIEGNNTVIVDFNLAYSPYCAYTDKYSCPIPPKENFLLTKIEAGEKVFSEY